MIDPFFSFFDRERINISQKLQGRNTELFKEYPDLIKVPLPQTEVHNTELYRILQERESAIGYSQESISLEALTNILKLSAGLKDKNPERRNYPSGGAKYPTEIYIAAVRVSGLEPGLYHYTSLGDFLTLLKNISQEELMQCFPANHSSAALREAAAIVFMTFSKGRSIKKYGDFAYKLGLLEAGHIGQNFYLSSVVNNIGCRAYAGGYTEAINNILDIDGIGETIIYTISLGIKK